MGSARATHAVLHTTVVNYLGLCMTTSISDLIAQRESLERQIREAQVAAKRDALARVRQLMAEHHLTVTDLTPQSAAKSDKRRTKVAPKYRDPASGATWTGRGLKPKWLNAAIESGKSVTDFVIQSD